jgi:hypothetical protein
MTQLEVLISKRPHEATYLRILLVAAKFIHETTPERYEEFVLLCAATISEEAEPFSSVF